MLPNQNKEYKLQTLWAHELSAVQGYNYFMFSVADLLTFVNLC